MSHLALPYGSTTPAQFINCCAFYEFTKCAAQFLNCANSQIAPNTDLPSVTELRDLRDQLQRKDGRISALDGMDAEILKHIKDEEELVKEVCEAEDIKESILTSIAHVTHIIDTLSVTVSEPNPISTQSDTSTTQTLVEPSTADPTSVELTPPTSVELTPPTSVEQPPPSDVPTPLTHVVRCTRVIS